MSMLLGGTREKAEINITPMIDVLLVLIIIFMVITPLAPRGLDTLLPRNPSAEGGQVEPSREIVVTVCHDGTFLLNREPLTQAALEERLTRLFRKGAADVVFVRGDRDLEFHQVAEVIDLARGVGVYHVALMPY